jgi:hypothetical protein
MVLDSVRGPSFQEAVFMVYWESKITLLHAAVYGLSWTSFNTPTYRNWTAQHLEPLISEILAAGADIHTTDGQGSTPFSYLIGQFYRRRTCFRWTLSRWLKVVQSAVYDLSEYIHREIKNMLDRFNDNGSVPFRSARL